MSLKQDDETLQLFIEESREHLADIENDLLAIEAAGEEVDEELINKVFRAAHSIKGGAGFMALDNIKQLAHKTETILGRIRSGEILPNPEVITILLKAFDKLRDLVNDVDRSKKIDISGNITALDSSSAPPREETGGLPRVLDVPFFDGKGAFSISESDITQARKTGKFIYLIEYDLIHDAHNRGKMPLDIIVGLQKGGTILDSKVDVTALRTLGEDPPVNESPFAILFESIADPSIIGTLCKVDDRRIRLITEQSVTSAPPADAPVRAKSSPTIAAASDHVSLKPDSEKCTGKISSTEVHTETGTKGIEHPSRNTPVEKRGDARTARPDSGQSPGTNPTSAETTLRVHIGLLDSLMTLAGELVLSRNQLMQAISSDNKRSLEVVGQRIDLVTSELQEAIMLTRMQPIGNIFNKFPRIVRDLARDLNKVIELVLEGKEVELDKTIIETLNDPLTHLIRNAVDHGIEPPEARRILGKNPVGRILLSAYHEAGQVNIEITDDGKGLDSKRIVSAAIGKGLITEEQARAMSERERINLIFLPGFSTAEEVTDISGRGVGMDVVKTNLDRLGGVADIVSEPGRGTTIRIKLPLTLAIIPSMLVSTGGERYAIPQANVDELLRIPAAQVKERIEKVGNAEVVRLRGKLLPLLSLVDVLGIERTYIDLHDNEEKSDRRQGIADRRSRRSPLFADNAAAGDQPAADKTQIEIHDDRRVNPDRRYRSRSAVNIVVVSAGASKYGLVVDEVHDSQEIVVKPLGRHLKQCSSYAGATIMGDGRVALILDVASLGRIAALTSVEGTDRAAEVAKEVADAITHRKHRQSLLIFRSGADERFAISLDLVARIERIEASKIEHVGGKKVIQHRGGSLPLFAIEEVAKVKPIADREDLLVIVLGIAGREVGLLATGPVDAMEVSVAVDDTTLKQPGIMGSAIIENHTTLMVDIFGLVETLNPGWFANREKMRSPNGNGGMVLLVEDSDFFRNQIRGFIENEGYRVLQAEDGLIAWNLLQRHADEVSVVVTDIEMPNLDGYGLTKRIKEDQRFSRLPVIAVTSLAGDEDIARGKDAGIDDYQIKMDKEKLMESIRNCTN